MFNPYLHAAHAACWVENKEKENADVRRRNKLAEEIKGDVSSSHRGGEGRHPRQG